MHNPKLPNIQTVLLPTVDDSIFKLANVTGSLSYLAEN